MDSPLRQAELDDPEDLILSDVHLGVASAPSHERISRFRYRTCDHSSSEGEDTFETATIVHRMATPLKLVGAQVWSGSLLLGDYLLSNAEALRGRKVYMCMCCSLGLP